jgi:hypothetical protein
MKAHHPAEKEQEVYAGLLNIPRKTGTARSERHACTSFPQGWVTMSWKPTTITTARMSTTIIWSETDISI